MKKEKTFALSLIVAAFLLLFPLLLTACGGRRQIAPDTSAPSGSTLMDDSIAEDTAGDDIPVLGSQDLKRQDIRSITFLSDTSQAPAESWDVSKMEDGSVLAWAVKSGELYALYIAADNGVIASKNCNGMFCGYTNVERIVFNSAFDTSHVINMSHMFRGCHKLTELDVGGFDTSNVMDMSSMFGGCNMLTELDVSGFNTSNVTNIGTMFENCSALMTLDVRNFDTSNVTNMWGMFKDCHSLTTLDVSGFNTSNVKSMGWMFWGCSSLTELDVRGFDTSNVKNIEWIFSDCPAVTEEDISGWDLSNATDADRIFSY